MQNGKNDLIILYSNDPDDEIDRIFEKNRKPTYTKPVILTEYDGRKESE